MEENSRGKGKLDELIAFCSLDWVSMWRQCEILEFDQRMVFVHYGMSGPNKTPSELETVFN